jgi:hypothetical protein
LLLFTPLRPESMISCSPSANATLRTSSVPLRYPELTQAAACAAAQLLGRQAGKRRALALMLSAAVSWCACQTQALTAACSLLLRLLLLLLLLRLVLVTAHCQRC